MIWFRHADRRFPFLWEGDDQPPARWHGLGDGPAHYLCDTPDGAWAEHLRHEYIDDAADLAGIRRALWAVDVPAGDESKAAELPRLPAESHGPCQERARALRVAGARAIAAPSAALVAGGARGQVVDAGLREAPARDGRVLVLYGRRPDLCGWLCADGGRPAARLLPLVRPQAPAR
jgi:hypothetical protein